MNSRICKTVLLAACLGAAAAPAASAVSFSANHDNCLFRLRAVRTGPPLPTLFPIFSITSVLFRPELLRKSIVSHSEPAAEPAVRTQFEAETHRPLSGPLTESRAATAGVDPFERLDLEGGSGLMRPLNGRASLGFGYSDVFETKADPDKGGHGPGVMFRYKMNR